MDVFINSFAQLSIFFLTFLELVSAVGGLLFFVLFVWLATSRKADTFFAWIYDEFFHD